MKKFEKGFLLGAATAAHQVEGNNTNSDCWAMEQMEYTAYAEPSLDAVDHYTRYEEDICLMAKAGLNAYRFSVEWARIEPEEGMFDEEQIEHYRKVIRCCKEHGIEPIVTLHHFSSPVWVISKGGWEAKSIVGDFEKYVRYVMEKLGDELHYVCTINEANIGLQIAGIAERYKKMMMAQMQRAGEEKGGSETGWKQRQCPDGNESPKDAGKPKSTGRRKSESIRCGECGELYLHADNERGSSDHESPSGCKTCDQGTASGDPGRSDAYRLHDIQVAETGGEAVCGRRMGRRIPALSSIYRRG